MPYLPIVAILLILSFFYWLYRPRQTPQAKAELEAAWQATIAVQTNVLQNLGQRATRSGGVCDPAIPTAERPHISIHPVTPDDFIALQDIFESLEGRQIPRGLDEHFTRAIADQRGLYLVCKLNGKIVGGAGMSLPQVIQGTAHYTFYFNQVSPEFQRRGLGSLLFLARLACISPPHPVTAISTHVLPAGMALIQGFETNQIPESVHQHPDGFQTETHVIFLSPQHLTQAGEMLSGLNISLDPAGKKSFNRKCCSKSG
jgi:GNAT superfamily N-acetyltransferase